MFNVKGAVQVPLEIFGGLVTNMPAMNLPAGVSPDCQDMAFRPGSVFSRPALAKILATSVGVTTLTYAKSFTDNAGIVRNLYLDATGNLWVENLNASTMVMLAAVTPGSYAKSITAFGREYIAFSDGIHGTEVALQYDGTNLDRVTQDGPGAPPTVGNLVIPAVAMLSGGAGPSLTVISATTTNLVGGNYTRVTITLASGGLGLRPGDIVTITGNSNSTLNQTAPLAQVVSDTQIITYGFYPAFETGTGGSTSATSAYSISRANNIVTVNTAVPHGLQVGYQAQISGVDATAVPVAAISSIVINNVDSPGIATITTAAAHGLASGENIVLKGISSIVAAAISAVSRQGGIVTVTTSAAHNLVPGAVVSLSGVSDGTFNTTLVITNVTDSTHFVALQADSDATSSGGNVNLSWPIPDTVDPQVFEVLNVPSDTSFQVAINWSDGTWTDGHVYLPWDGTYYVFTVPSPTQFQYKQNGPDMQSTAIGTVTPVGQIAPGQHQLQVLFLTRQGYVTRPSPPVLWNANGGQYVTVSDIPTGPPNVVARILAFTGADGAYFFYIPVPAQVNGQIVSTATQINDNTTTSAILDFGDNTLFAALGISIPGNDLANMAILDSALGFAFYGDRLITYGQRNCVQNLLNMGFDGGTLPTLPGVPTGWSGTGTVMAGNFSQGVSVPSLTQSFYEDAYGAPIALANQQYTARCWSTMGATVKISSASTGFSATATIVAGPGGWGQADFSAKTPATIPPDLIIKLTAPGIVDDLSLIYTDDPFVNNEFLGSYVNNPEAFDNVSGVFGVEDTRKILTTEIIRGSLYVLTQDPGGRLHVIQNNGVTEPVGWSVNEVAANCGVMSPFASTVSQADDATAGGGEEWFAWMSFASARIFGGDQAYPISQEIQPNWNSINPAAWLTTWALNDPVANRIYFGLPIGNAPSGALATAPNKLYHVDYQQLYTAYEIAEANSIHISFTGKLTVRERSRKWCPWNIPANGAAMIYRAVGGPLTTVFFVGNGLYPGKLPGGCGNAFALCDNKFTDDCLGQFFPYYTTYAFTSAQDEQGLQLGGQRHLLQYLQWNASGQVGNIRVTLYVNTLSNPWPIKTVQPLLADPTRDNEWGGGQASGQRVFVKFEGLPA